jgi:hypothetical protein
MSRQFNNSTGTTSTEFQLGAGTGAEVRQFVLTASVNGAPVMATDRASNEIAVAGVEFYDIKLLAKDATGTVARHIRGTVSGTTTTRITDTFQEDFDGDIAVTSNGTTFSVECTSTTSANFTIYVTLTRVSA